VYIGLLHTFDLTHSCVICLSHRICLYAYLRIDANRSNSIHTYLLSVYRARLSVYRVLLSVCRALLSPYRALLSVHRASEEILYIPYESM